MCSNKVTWNGIANDFRAAMAILPNNIRVPCVECRGCSLRILNPNDTRISKHRKACPHRYQFKYMYPKNAGERLTVKCLLCSEIINSTAMSILLCHRTKCLPPQPNPSGSEVSHAEPQIYYMSTDELFNSGEVNFQMYEPHPDEVSTQMEVSNEVVVAEDSNDLVATVTTSSTQSKGNDSFKRTWDTDAGIFDFKIVRVRENGRVKRCMQCLLCSKIIRTVGWIRVKSHRNVCSRQTLVTTTTTPHERNANQNDDEIQDVKQCFICDSSVQIRSNSDRRDHVNLYNTNTSHSDTPIYDLVWKFLGENPSQRNLTATEADSQWNLVCLNCFQNIEDYDFATSESQRLEKVLMAKLSITEKAYEERNKVKEQNNVEEQTNVEENDETIQADEDAEMTETDDDIEIIEANEIIELIISDDEYEESEESSQSHRTVVQTPQTAPQSPQPTQTENEANVIIELNSDESGESETRSDDEAELVELFFPDPLTETDERELTFNEL